MVLSGSAASGEMRPKSDVDHALSTLVDILKEPAGKIVRDASIQKFEYTSGFVFFEALSDRTSNNTGFIEKHE